MFVLKSTYKIQSKLSALFCEKSREFLNNVQCEGRDDCSKLWHRYLIRNKCVCAPSRTRAKKNYLKINDPIYPGEILVPCELAEKILILNSMPPTPYVETVGDLCIVAITRAYRIKNFNIPVYESISSRYLLLFSNQHSFADYDNRKQVYEKASMTIPLSSKIRKIIGSEAITDHATLIFNWPLELNLSQIECR